MIESKNPRKSVSSVSSVFYKETSPQPVFELFDTTLAATVPEVAGLWTTTPLTSTEAVSFAAGAEASSEMPADTPVWRANLPANLNVATAQLAAGEASLTASQQAIQEIPHRLDTLIQISSSGQAFDISSKGQAFSQPETELLVFMDAIQGGTVSFGLGDMLPGGWQPAIDRFQTVADRMLQSIVHYAWVETCVQEQCLARTAVGWTGDMNTIWQHRLKTEQGALHQQTLRLALQSRNTVVRTFILAVQGAAKISMLLLNPGSAVLMLPAIWKFVNQILAEKNIS